MMRFKIKVQAKRFERESWMFLSAADKKEALQVAHSRCSFADNIYYPIDKTLEQISEEEYVKWLNE